MKKKEIPFFPSIRNIGCLDKDLMIFKSIILTCSTFSNDPDVPWQMAMALLYEDSVMGILKNIKQT